MNLDFLQNQLAVSAFVVTQVVKYHRKRIFMQVPPGKGKSRMIASVVLGIAQRSTSLDKVVVVFNCEFLKQVDEKVLNAVRYHLANDAVNKRRCEIKCVVGMKEGLKLCNGKTLLVIDEGDYNLLDDTEHDFMKTKDRDFYAVFAMSATLPESDKYATYMLKSMRFLVFDSNIRGTLRASDCSLMTDLQVFLEDNDPPRAKLIFTDHSKVKEVRSKAQGSVFEENPEDKDFIENLTPNHVVIVTNERNMRGYNYRCPEGINLLIDKTFSNERAFIQGLGRVGRHDEDCKRFISPCIQPYK